MYRPAVDNESTTLRNYLQVQLEAIREESSTTLRQMHERIKSQYLALIARTDLDAVMQAPPAPWYGLPGGDDIAMRYLVVHHLEEFARHAGHADIIREEIDGAQAASLNAAVENRAANDFVQPWQPPSARQ